jgi:hypothetical protein
MDGREWSCSTSAVRMLQFILSDDHGNNRPPTSDRKLKLLVTAIESLSSRRAGPLSNHTAVQEAWLWCVMATNDTDPLCPIMANLMREIYGQIPPTQLRHLGSGTCLTCFGSGTTNDHYPPLPCPACSCVTPTVLSIARAAYEAGPDKCPGRLAVLSDALEEAGCDNQALLMHLRGKELCTACYGTGTYRTTEGVSYGCPLCGDGINPGAGWRTLPISHVRGCWALDLILSME